MNDHEWLWMIMNCCDLLEIIRDYYELLGINWMIMFYELLWINTNSYDLLWVIINYYDLLRIIKKIWVGEGFFRF